MATGSLIATNNICLNVILPICQNYFFPALNGYENVYNDTDPNCCVLYYEYFYCSSGYIYPENSQTSGIYNTGEYDVTGTYCCVGKSDGTGGYYWDRLYCSGTILNFTTGNSGIVCDLYTISGNNIYNITGFYCCLNISDGIGGFYFEKVPYCGTIFYKIQDLYINIQGQNYTNGAESITADGCGNLFDIYKYCNIGYLFSCSGLYEFVSNGFGGFSINELNSRNIYNVCINWDFSKRTKNLYNFTEINACGSDICLSINNCSNLFYEINSISNTKICIYEANLCNALYIEDASTPFIYLKNIGSGCLNIDLSKNNCYSFFKEKQICGKINYIDESILLKPKESIFLNLNVSSDGSEYYSNVIYPFGFFYEFKDIENVNPLGLYPVCCIFDSFTFSNIPTFTYASVCNLPIESGCIVQTGFGYCYKKLLSFNENLIVDCSNLEISFFKNTGSGILDIFEIQRDFNLNSNYGINSNQTSVKTNEIVIYDNFDCCVISNISGVYSKQINLDNTFNIIYDVDFCSQKKYKLIYLDCCCASGDYDFLITVDSNTGLNCFSKQCFYSCSGVLDLKNNDIAYIDIYLCEDTAIKDLANSYIKRNNLYLPVKNDFNYCYNFILNKTNFLNEKCQSGFWGNNSGILTNNSGFCNYTTLINCNDLEYQQYKSNIYSIDLFSDENRKNTCSIQDKNNFEKSDYFLINYCTIECSFYYCCLEFRYVPVDTIFYKNIFYKISDEYINVNFCSSNCCESISFPINAVNQNKIKINTTFDIFDSVFQSNLNASFSNFNFELNCLNSNIINYKFPIIQCENLSGYEFPNISINNKLNRLTQSNINFTINPAKNFNCDYYYGLNNFLLFLNSKMNSGIAFDFLNCNSILMCDYEYNSTNYSFLMIDLNLEYTNCLTGLPISGDWIKVLERISFEDNFELIPYKNNTGDGYNYVYPIFNKICYTDIYTGNNEVKCIDIIQSGLLNYLNTGFSYDGFASEEVGLTGYSGEFTGFISQQSNQANFLNVCNSNIINLTKNDLTGTISCRCISISKNYNFTGVQPIYINSNYILADISEPIVCTNLLKYSSNINEDQTSGLFYYLYDIGSPKNLPIKIVAPDYSFISKICWNNDDINPICNNSKYYQIINNISKLNLQIDNFIYENPYIINTGIFKTLYINIVGGL